jgi:hypothetical protein
MARKLGMERVRTAAERVSEDVIAAVLLLHHSSVDEIAPQLLRWKRDMQRATVSDVANSCEQEGIAVAAA